MRKFVIVSWSEFPPHTVVWCRQKVCDTCQLRFLCWSMKDDIIIYSRPHAPRYFFLGNIEFIFTKVVHPFQPKREDGCQLPFSVENMVERFISGEEIPVPNGQWNHGWVFQAKIACQRNWTYCNVCDLDRCQGVKK